MIALPPLPPVEVQPVDIEIQVPNFDDAAIQHLMTDLFGIRLNAEARILTLQPAFPLSWQGENVALTTADFDFSVHYLDSLCTWSFEGFGAFAERYDSIIVHAPDGTLMAGELADAEGVNICYAGAAQELTVPSVERKLTRKERKELAKQEKERKKREKAQAKKKK